MAGLMVMPITSLDHWSKALDLRHEVFVVGQNVPETLEVDLADMSALHVIATREGRAVGTGRMVLEADGPLDDAPHVDESQYLPRSQAKAKLPILKVNGSGEIRGRVGRMAVVEDERGRGVGRLLLGALEGQAWRKGITRIVLASQEGARGFYETQGYQPWGEPFMEAGIKHIWMEKTKSA